MKVKAWVSFQPTLHLGEFVRGVVIQNPVNLQMRENLQADGHAELDPLLVPVPLGTMSQDFSFQVIQRGK